MDIRPALAFPGERSDSRGQIIGFTAFLDSSGHTPSPEAGSAAVHGLHCRAPAAFNGTGSRTPLLSP